MATERLTETISIFQSMSQVQSQLCNMDSNPEAEGGAPL